MPQPTALYEAIMRRCEQDLPEGVLWCVAGPNGKVCSHTEARRPDDAIRAFCNLYGCSWDEAQADGFSLGQSVSAH